MLFSQEGIQKMIIKYNLRKADCILSTSNGDEVETKKYTDKCIEVTPFGVDLNIFKNYDNRKDDEIIIGIVKSLEKVYGIDYLIIAFSQLVNKYPEYNFKLQILGEGTQLKNLNEMVRDLKIEDKVKFMKSRDLQGVCQFYNDIHIAVFPSISESFGVAVIEAQACRIQL